MKACKKAFRRPKYNQGQSRILSLEELMWEFLGELVMFPLAALLDHQWRGSMFLLLVALVVISFFW
jgi:hypothetical protein